MNISNITTTAKVHTHSQKEQFSSIPNNTNNEGRYFENFENKSFIHVYEPFPESNRITIHLYCQARIYN